MARLLVVEKRNGTSQTWSVPNDCRISLINHVLYVHAGKNALVNDLLGAISTVEGFLEVGEVKRIPDSDNAAT